MIEKVESLINPVVYENDLANRKFDRRKAPLLALIEDRPNVAFRDQGGDKVTIIETPEDSLGLEVEIGDEWEFDKLEQTVREAEVKEYRAAFQISDRELKLGYNAEKLVDMKASSLEKRLNLAINKKARDILADTKTKVELDELGYDEIVSKAIPKLGVGEAKYIIVNEEGYGMLASDKRFIPAGAEEQKTGIIGRLAGLQIIIDRELKEGQAFITVDKPILQFTKNSASVIKDVDRFNPSAVIRVGASENKAFIIAHDEYAVINVSYGAEQAETKTAKK